MPAHLDASFLQKVDTELKESGVEVLHRTLAGLENFDLGGRVAYLADSPYLAGGAYSDIRIGDCAISEHGRVRVAVKCIRLYLRDNPEVIKLIEREVRLWSKLNHPNILPLLGYTIEQHVRSSSSRQRHHALGTWTCGRYFLSSQFEDNTPDIKSDNVLVSQLGEPLICDFEQYNQRVGAVDVSRTSTSIREHAVHSKESDIWAFCMTVYEVLTKRRPYYRLVSDPQVITSIICGELPRKPRASQNWPAQYHLLWEICKACWSLEPAERPSAAQLASVLTALIYPSTDNGSRELISTVHRSFGNKSEHRSDSSPHRKNMTLPNRRPTYNTFADMGIHGRKLESETRSCVIM
ncbi:hypothetical protein ACEPAI_8301 [Sanghuangporus weigelae]